MSPLRAFYVALMAASLVGTHVGCDDARKLQELQEKYRQAEDAAKKAQAAADAARAEAENAKVQLEKEQKAMKRIYTE